MKTTLLIATVVLLALGPPSRAEPSGGLDWSAWARLPVLENGRVMPLDSFARVQVKKICGAVNPRLGLAGAAIPAEAAPLLPKQTAREFTDAELLFAWLAEPEKWEHIPLLRADDQQLRAKLLGAPLYGEDGRPLEYVSPHQVSVARKLHERIEDLGRREEEARKENESLEPSALDRKARDLYEAYTLYRQLTFDPTRPADGRAGYADSVIAMARSWLRLEDDLLRLPAGDSDQSIAGLAVRASETMRKLVGPLMEGVARNLETKNVEPLLASLEHSTAELADRLADLYAREIPPGALPEGRVEELRARLGMLAARTAEVARLAVQAHVAWYDPGEAVRLLPAMEPAALEADRYRADIQPWIALPAMIYGSGDLLGRYPSEPLHEVREAYRRAVAVYRDREDPRRPAEFAAAMERFAAALRTLATAIEPQRRQLPIREPDEAILAATAYPPPGATDAEVLYNRLDPFFWSWLVSLAAVSCLAVSFLGLRKPMFWLAVAVLVAAHAFILAGFGLRMCITHWAPVTNMFETIAFVALCVAFLTLWLTFLPLLQPGGSAAWRLTAFPGTWEAGKGDSPIFGAACATGSASAESPTTPALAKPVAPKWAAGGWAVAVPRLALMGYVAHLTGVFQVGWPGGGYRLLTLLPRIDIGSTLPTPSAVLIWLGGLCVVAAMVWYLPRLIVAAFLVLPAAAGTLGGHRLAQRLDQVYERRLVALVGAMVALGAALLAYYAPFPKDIKALTAVLRSNVWLAVHVLTITAGYGAAALAWGLGNIALGYYLFGNYRLAGQGTVPIFVGRAAAPKMGLSPSAQPVEEAVEDAPAEGGQEPAPSGDWHHLPQSGPAGALHKWCLSPSGRLAPEASASLARLNYRVIQVAVLLLAVGTILGGMWADVSWGRFWGWDPKEVWALISLLVYMIILHARRAGWTGDFGLAVGSVLGFTAIVWAWYGVNYLMPGGKHSYGEGTSGQWAVVGAIVLNWFFLAQAAVRASIAGRRGE